VASDEYVSISIKPDAPFSKAPGTYTSPTRLNKTKKCQLIMLSALTCQVGRLKTCTWNININKVICRDKSHSGVLEHGMMSTVLRLWAMQWVMQHGTDGKWH